MNTAGYKNYFSINDAECFSLLAADIKPIMRILVRTFLWNKAVVMEITLISVVAEHYQNMNF